MKVLRIIFFLLIVFLAMPELVLGVPSLMNGIRAHGDVWSVRHDYFGDAAITLIAGLVAVSFAAWAAFWPGKANWVRFLVATGIVLLMAISLPGWYMDPLARARDSEQTTIFRLGLRIDAWAEKTHRYPLSKQELIEATDHHDDIGLSPYQKNGQQLSYEFKVVPDATGAALCEDYPASLCYAVNTSGTWYWLTGSTLTSVGSSNASALRIGNTGNTLVIAGNTLELPRPNTSKPAPKK